MRKTTIVAMAAAITLAAVQPAAATGSGGLNANQVRKIVKEEVKKIPRGPRGPAGPPGPQGPAGMDGMPFLFANVASSGLVHEDVSNGITNENIRREEGGNIVRYCFFGLPPVVGGQVTLLSGGFSAVRMIDLHVDPEGTGDCPILVQTSGVDADGNLIAEAQSFYILLY